MEHAFYDKLVFSGVKETLGFDRIRFMVTGSAPISDECLILLRVIFGCPVIQGLGLSETGGGICCSYMHDMASSAAPRREWASGARVRRSWCRCRRWATW